MPRRGDSPDPTARAFGDAVRRAREARGLTQEGLSDRIARMDPRYLGELELGWHAPTIVTAKRIADALEMPLSQLVAHL